MKYFYCVVLLAAAVVGEPPRYRDSRFRSERQEQAPSDDAPYPAAGFRPEREFKLPSRQELSPPSTSYGVPADSYGAPFQTYAAPQTQYGVPSAEGRSNEGRREEGRREEGRKEDGNEENKNSADDSEKVEKLDGEKKENFEDGSKKDAQVITSQGAYYVLLPGSDLQRVQFQTENDIRRMSYTARLRYSDADRAPIYVVNPAYQQAASYVEIF